MKKVLLTNALLRMTLAATRSLGKKGLQVVLSEETRLTPAMFSKYCHTRLVSPNPHKDPEKYYAWLIETLAEHECDVLFPMDDDVMDIAVKHQHELRKICKLPIPTAESYAIASDKSLAEKAAIEAGLTCPHAYIIDEAEDIGKFAAAINYPVLIKPRISSGSRGIKRVERQSDFKEIYSLVDSKYPKPSIQQYIPPSAKYGVCLLFDQDSHVKAAFVQKYIRHYPLDIGSSVVQESVYYPELIEQAIAVMQKIKWYGVAEVEFLVDQNGKPYFLEINPRFWGCLQMAILAGVDFPWLLYRLAVDGDVEEVFDYRVGIRCRWLLYGDILHFLADKNRFKMDPPFLAGRKKNVYDDTISGDDPLPVLGFFMACLYYALDKDMRKKVLKGD